MNEDNLIIVKEALTTIAASSNIVNFKFKEDSMAPVQRDDLERMLDEIEEHTTRLRDGIKKARYEDEERKVLYHESHNNIAPAECGRMWKAVEKKKYEKIVLWYQWKGIKKKQRCRMCRIGNREIKGTEKEREKLQKDRKKARKAMGWD